MGDEVEYSGALLYTLHDLAQLLVGCVPPLPLNWTLSFPKSFRWSSERPNAPRILSLPSSVDVDLDALVGELLVVVRTTVHPAHASVWLASSPVEPERAREVCNTEPLPPAKRCKPPRAGGTSSTTRLAPHARRL